jgi:succinyl-CoA synthetase beta subunit
MDIEEVAEKNPGAIITLPVDIVAGLTVAAAAKLAAQLGFEARVAGSDAVDAKLNFDDKAAFRQKGVYTQRNTAMEDPRDGAENMPIR